MAEKTLGIYVHIPFCKQKCAYCDFCSHPPADAAEQKRYVNALLLHISDYAAAAAEYTVDTVFFGGGTPTLLPAGRLCELLECIRDHYKLDRDAEITLEANPGTVTKSDLRTLRRAGFNRISFGLQSASDKELRALGRIHDRATFEESFRAARAAGFANINVDLMFGIPHQTAESFHASLSYVRNLAPEHISVYGLKIEEGTPFYAQRERLPLPDEETEYKMYIAAHKYLTGCGYTHYEISNYARTGLASRHNKRYWLDGEYLGFGVAAHSYFDGQRYAYTEDMEAYMSEMETPHDVAAILSECTDIDVFTKETEYVMLRLRLFEGLSLDEYEETFGRSFLSKYGAKIKTYIDGGFMTLSKTRCAFTLKGMYVSNCILSDILTF